MNIQLIIDSTTDLPQSIIQQYNMKVVPLSVLFGEKEYFDLTPEVFYKLLAEAEVMPTTSQVPPERFIKAFEEALKEKDHVVCITIGSNASGTYQSATIAKEALDSDRITVIDSNMLCLGTGYLVLKIARMIEAGTTIEAILELAADYTANNIEHLFSVDTIEYLKKGGRLKGAKAVMAEVLNIKPILNVADGLTQQLGKVRGRKKVLGYYLKHIKETLDYDKSEFILVGHSRDLEFAKELEAALVSELNYTGEIIFGEIGAIIGTHTGPGVLACFYYKK